MESLAFTNRQLSNNSCPERPHTMGKVSLRISFSMPCVTGADGRRAAQRGEFSDVNAGVAKPGACDKLGNLHTEKTLEQRV